MLKFILPLMERVDGLLDRFSSLIGVVEDYQSIGLWLPIAPMIVILVSTDVKEKGVPSSVRFQPLDPFQPESALAGASLFQEERPSKPTFIMQKVVHGGSRFGRPDVLGQSRLVRESLAIAINLVPIDRAIQQGIIDLRPILVGKGSVKRCFNCFLLGIKGVFDLLIDLFDQAIVGVPKEVCRREVVEFLCDRP